MQKPKPHEWAAIVAGVGLLGLIGYLYFKHASAQTANTQSASGPLNLVGYDPTGGVSVLNIGGALGPNGFVAGNNIGNSTAGDTPIGVDPLTGNVINTIESDAAGSDVVVSPSSWQGTTGPSGSITYLNGELAGEGSGPISTQGVTY